ncbi:MAG: transglycosylase domain-containing protein [Deltaproteobacteria bacterium]|nr:transglycosylase domain-containing protein [Deltaproteobacteria bacterium]
MRRHRRLALGLGIGLGSLLLLAVAAWIALPFLVRAYVLQRLQQRFGVTLEAAEIDAGFGSVELRDVRVSASATGLPLGTLAAVEADVDLWALLGGRVGIRRLELRSPQVAIRVSGDEQWGEVVRLVRQVLRGSARLAGGRGGAAPEVVVRDLSVAVEYGDELSLSAAVPRLDYGAGRRLRVAAGELRLATGPHEVLRASSASAALVLAGGGVVVEEALVTGAAARWERAPGEPIDGTPAYRAGLALRRLLHTTREAWSASSSDADAGAPATVPGASPEPACRLPLEGTIRFAKAAVDVFEPRLGAGPLAGRAIEGRLLLERCGDRVRLDAAGDRGADAGGWDAWVERTAVGTSGEVEASAAELDDLARRLWPGHRFPPVREGTARLELAHHPGEERVRLAGELPVPQLELAAAGHRLVVGPERAPFELQVGPLADGRLGLAGKVELAAARYEGPDGAGVLSGALLQLEPETHVAFGLDGTRVSAAVTGRFAEPVGLLADPALRVVEPELRADLTFRREGEGRVGFDGSYRVRGVYQPADAGLPATPVELAGAFDPGTWVRWSSREAAVRGRVLADGLRIERPRLPLVVFGPPGIELALDVRPGDGDGRWIAEGELGVRGLTVDSPKVAREPVSGLAFDVSGTFALDLPGRQATLEQGRARVGAVEMAVSVVAVLRDPPAFRAAFAGSRTRCQDLLEALPLPLRGDLPGLEFSGSADFHVGFDIDFADLSDTVFDLQATSRCRVTAADGSIEMDRLRGTFRHEIVLPDGRIETVVTGPGSVDWVPLSGISPYMVSAVITTEDARFFRHSGVSIQDLRTAIVRDLRAGRFVYGGSTIDMQVVKNVFLDREKTVARKLQELVLTWWMNQALTKNQILELYLNVIEYGPGIYGIGPAARHFFGRTPADLSPLEALYLAKLLPEPLARYRMYERDAVPTAWRARLDRILGVMRSRGHLDEEEYQAAIHDRLDFWQPGEPLPEPRYGGTPPAAEAPVGWPEEDPDLWPEDPVIPEELGGGYPADPDL